MTSNNIYGEYCIEKHKTERSERERKKPKGSSGNKKTGKEEEEVFQHVHQCRLSNVQRVATVVFLAGV